MNEISALVKETPESSLTSSTIWGHRSGFSVDTESASPLILDF